MPTWLPRESIQSQQQAAATVKTQPMLDDVIAQIKEAITPKPPAPTFQVPSLDDLIGMGKQTVSTVAASAQQVAPDLSGFKLPTLADLGITEPEPAAASAPTQATTATASAPTAPGRAGVLTSPAGVAGAQPAAPGGAIDNSSRESFVRTAYPWALQAAGGDPKMAQHILAIAVSENGDIGTGKDLSQTGWNFGGVHAQPGERSWQGLDAGRPTAFRAYDNPAQGLRSFIDFLEQNPRYAEALARYRQTGDINQLTIDANNAGYSETPTWPQNIRNIRETQIAPITRGQAQAAAPAAQGQQQAPQGGALDVNDVAKRYGGGTYTFGGGRDGNGYGIPGDRNGDCSSFVSAIWKEQGIDLIAHTDSAYSQLRGLGAQQVSAEQARPGDVVFYMGAGYGGAVTYHMGIYAGPGQVLDMSSINGMGARVRPLTHAGSDIVILRDPRVNGRADPRQATAPPPITPSGIAESPQGAQLVAQAGQAEQSVAPSLHPKVASAYAAANGGAQPTPSEVEELRMLGLA